MQVLGAPLDREAVIVQQLCQPDEGIGEGITRRFHQLHAHGTAHVPRTVSPVLAPSDEAGRQLPTCSWTLTNAGHQFNVYSHWDSYHSMSYSFRVPHNTITGIVKEVSTAIVANTKTSCLTSLDGKQIVIKTPKKLRHLVLQLQEVLLHFTVSPGRFTVQVPVD